MGTTAKGVANGLATLGSDGVIPDAQLPTGVGDFAQGAAVSDVAALTSSAASGGDSPTEAEHNALRSTVDSIRTQLVALAADAAALRARQTILGYVYSAATTLKLTFGSMSGKNLNDLDVGEVHIFAQITDTLAPV